MRNPGYFFVIQTWATETRQKRRFFLCAEKKKGSYIVFIGVRIQYCTYEKAGRNGKLTNLTDTRSPTIARFLRTCVIFLGGCLLNLPTKTHHFSCFTLLGNRVSRHLCLAFPPLRADLGDKARPVRTAAANKGGNLGTHDGSMGWYLPTCARV